MRRGLVKPIFETELEPGQAARHALGVVHPVNEDVAVDPILAANIERVCSDPAGVVADRTKLLDFWKKRAVELMPQSLEEIGRVKDAPLRRLLLGVPDGQTPKLGDFLHTALWRELADAGQCKDKKLIDEMVQGMSIVGPVGKSDRWPPLEKAKAHKPLKYLTDRAWEVKKKINGHLRGTKVTPNSEKIWDSTIKDRDEGSCLGPFWSESEVSSILGCEDWIPTQRFEVCQKNKVRGCDSATVNLVNVVAEILEKLQLPTTDMNVGALRMLMEKAGGKGIHGWVLDEKCLSASRDPARTSEVFGGRVQTLRLGADLLFRDGGSLVRLGLCCL